MTREIRILLVEDSPADAKLLAHALRRGLADATIERVDREDTLRAALAAGPWHVVISDWSLPELDALRALAIVRASGLDLPFIIVSGTIGEELAVDAMRAGAHDYVLKHNLARLVPAIERELRECALRADHARQQARFRALIENSNEGILLTDATGSIEYASPAAARILGQSSDELVGTRGMALVHDDDRACLAAAIEGQRLADSAAFPMELRITRPDGSTRWLEVTRTNLVADPTVQANVTNLRDITERRRTTEALRASEARFARLAESGILGILVTELHGRVVEVNDTYANMIGYTRDELMSGAIRWTDLIPPDLAETTRASVAELVEHGTARPFESAAIHKDGRRVPMLVGVAMLDSPLSIAFSIDLTERKRAEEALRHSELHFRQAQKMEAVGRLAGGVAHDFNNVLSVILSYGEMLLLDLPEGDRLRADVDEICHASRRAAGLTRQLLMFSRQQVLEPKIFDVREIVAGMDNMLRRILGEDVELVTRRARTLGSIRADQSSIEQVIMNLVVNARDAMPTGGKLTMETSELTLATDDVREHGIARAGRYIVLAVTDNGIGMDAATQARIFEPFFTTKAIDKGTGLGLSTVFGIVQQAGGAVFVYSEVGLGTTFKVYLPCVDGDVAITPAGRQVVVGGTETILLVEDETQVRAVARGILRRQGYAVMEARDPLDALRICEQHEGEIHLLLTDVVMPKLAGPELASRIAALRPSIKVLCMSGYTDDSVVRHGILNDNIAFVQKPFTPASLARKVREVLDADG